MEENISAVKEKIVNFQSEIENIKKIVDWTESCLPPPKYVEVLTTGACVS